MNAKEIFKKYSKSHKNFVTHPVIKYGKIRTNLVYSLSKGRGINGENIYGITILEYIPEKGIIKKRHKLFNTFCNVAEANKYIERVKSLFYRSQFHPPFI
jgi:hypothetical protein